MPTYAALLLPSANRVYSRTAIDLMAAEVAVLDRAVLGGRLSGVAPREIGGVPYLTFAWDAELSRTDLDLLSNLSTVYALFRVEGELLAPQALRPLDRYDDDLLTILKYQGKTNQEFTKLLLNVTLWSSAGGAEMLTRRFSVFDPLCGRGTTLNQALMYGYDATGVDADRTDFDTYTGFVRTWLKNKRLKHRAEVTPVRRDRKALGHQLTVRMAAGREQYDQGRSQTLRVCHLDTTLSRKVYGAGSFDVVVTDAPYGVQHGSRQHGALRRSPLELLEAALPVWCELLRPGGAIGIAWNTKVAARDDVLGALTAAGLDPFDDGPYRDFGHRVDQAIVRDVVVARKAGPWTS